MNETIVRHALRELILNENTSQYTKGEAIDELIRIERKDALSFVPTVHALWNASMQEFREHRATNNGGRIGTIKLVREKLGCGLSEALIIVKGIESHYDIHQHD